MFLNQWRWAGGEGMGHEPQEIECQIVCLNVNFYGVALVMFSKGSKLLKKAQLLGWRNMW